MTFDSKNYLAVDLGAESGRVMLGRLQDGRLQISEAHRFANTPLHTGGELHWDLPALQREILLGLGKAGQAAGGMPSAIGLDTWGVYFALLDAAGEPMGNPFHYRDSRTNGMQEKAFRCVPKAEIYARTGIQFMQLNTLYQLVALAGTPALEQAADLLFIPDFLNYWLTGARVNEYTISTTSQCYDPQAGDWARGMLAKLDIPERIFGTIVPPGTRLGHLRPQMAAATGLPGVPVVAVGSHDTASAVAGVPAWTTDFIYISSGTWSLMGMEIPQPVITKDSLACNLTNEGGVNGTIRLLKNIMGMWLLQECRREWAAAGIHTSYDELTALAQQAPPLHTFIQPASSVFLAPGGMVERIQKACAASAQPVPHTQGEIVRCILESLALEYRRVSGQLESLTGKTASAIHIVGGGSRNQLLNRFTADCTAKLVVAGPVEATAIGNILMQAIGTGALVDLKAGRQVVHDSFTPQVFEPGPAAAWDEAYARFLALSIG